MHGLTDRQLEVLRFIARQIDDAGYPPTIREIGEALDIRSTNGVNDHLKALERKGYLSRDPAKSRALIPTSAARSALGEPSRPGNVVQLHKGGTRSGGRLVEIPIVGRVAAGQPILAVEQAEDTVRVDRFFLGAHREVFALRVKGESMIEAGIFDGDFIFVRKQAVASRGDIVVAMIEGEATVKRYFPEGDHIRFQPANSNMSPIIVKKSEFKQIDIIGIVVGVYRKL